MEAAAAARHLQVDGRLSEDELARAAVAEEAQREVLEAIGVHRARERGDHRRRDQQADERGDRAPGGKEDEAVISGVDEAVWCVAQVVLGWL